MKKFLNGIAAYLTDWKNWLVHGIFGAAILLIAVFLPVTPLVRLLLLAAVMVFNIIRMSIEKKNNPARAEVAVPVEDAPSDRRE